MATLRGVPDDGAYRALLTEAGDRVGVKKEKILGRTVIRYDSDGCFEIEMREPHDSRLVRIVSRCSCTILLSAVDSGFLRRYSRPPPADRAEIPCAFESMSILFEEERAEQPIESATVKSGAGRSLIRETLLSIPGSLSTFTSCSIQIRCGF